MCDLKEMLHSSIRFVRGANNDFEGVYANSTRPSKAGKNTGAMRSTRGIRLCKMPPTGDSVEFLVFDGSDGCAVSESG
jgi:hypothetical protein